MDPAEYARIAAVEDEHWWYRNTRALAAELLAPWLAAPGLRMLDAGCGTGASGAWLAAHGRVVGIDPSPEALALARANRPEIVTARGSLTDLPFGDDAFGVVVAITVLYTIDDDARATGEIARVLAPGGALLMLEPALPALCRAHDRTVHGRRRYRLDDLAALARSAGLAVERATYANLALVPADAALAAADRAGIRASAAVSDVERRALDPVFAAAAWAERRFIRRRDVPIGTSVVVVATRPV